jgi:hypothetical protein
METINYTLPEFVFLDGDSQEGDSLAGRTVLQHIRTYTIMEVIALDEIAANEFSQPTYQFEYKNIAGVVERHMFVLHFSMIQETYMPTGDALDAVFKRCAEWYCNYLAWEDGNISSEAKASMQ